MRGADLKSMFEQYGSVSEAVVISDRNTGRSKGFGFVTFENDAEADAATQALNGSDLQGRAMTVNEARPMEERAPRERSSDRGPTRRSSVWIQPTRRSILNRLAKFIFFILCLQ
jgi:RNA recognition motif-containing protein